eukprot:TRINITY_DN5332_c1_g1_i2.p1 TRINITY_DN5332_c1_g1~~TRINITY_DN5332_c1_g1_i2.p1  ORF type:complete len:1796 (+),score=396.41 TRINITY_DN5332_c1_g1_i2:2517-7904(+)
MSTKNCWLEGSFGAIVEDSTGVGRLLEYGRSISKMFIRSLNEDVENGEDEEGVEEGSSQSYVGDGDSYDDDGDGGVDGGDEHGSESTPAQRALSARHCRCSGFLGQGVIFNEDANLKVLDFPKGCWSLMCLRCVGTALPRRMVPLQMISNENCDRLREQARIEVATTYLKKHELDVPSDLSGKELGELVSKHNEAMSDAVPEHVFDEEREECEEEEEEEEEDLSFNDEALKGKQWQNYLPAFLQDISDECTSTSSFVDSDVEPAPTNDNEHQSDTESELLQVDDIIPVDTSSRDLIYRLESRFDFCCLTPDELLRMESWSDVFYNTDPPNDKKRRSPNKVWYLPHKCPKLKTRREEVPKWPNTLKEAGVICNGGNRCQYCHTREEFLFHPMRYKTIPCGDDHVCDAFDTPLQRLQATRTLRFMCPNYHAQWERDAFATWRAYWCAPCYNKKQFSEGKGNWETLLSTTHLKHLNPSVKQHYDSCYERWTNKRSIRNLREQILWLYNHCIVPCVASISWALTAKCDTVRQWLVAATHPPATVAIIRLAYPGSHLMLPMKSVIKNSLSKIKTLVSEATDPKGDTLLSDLSPSDKTALSRISFLQQPSEVKLYKDYVNDPQKLKMLKDAAAYLKNTCSVIYLSKGDRQHCVTNTMILATRIAEILTGTYIDKPSLTGMLWEEEGDQETIRQIPENKTYQNDFVQSAIKYAQDVLETEEQLQVKHRTRSQIQILLRAGISQKRAALKNCARNWNPEENVAVVSLFGSSVQGLAIGNSADTDLALGMAKPGSTELDQDGMTWQNRGMEKKMIEVLCNKFLKHIGDFDGKSLWKNQSEEYNLEVVRARVPIMKYEPTDLPAYESCDETRTIVVRLHEFDANTVLEPEKFQDYICSWGQTQYDDANPLEEDVFQDGVTYYLQFKTEELALAAIADLASTIDYSEILKESDLKGRPSATFLGLENESYQLPLLFHIPFDVSMRFTGPRGTQFLRSNIEQNPEWQGLFFIVKMWGKSSGVIASAGADSMLSSYALSVMLVDFIQRWCRDKGIPYTSVDPSEVRFSTKDDSLICGLQESSPRTAEALVDFFKHGYLFNYSENSIVFPSKHLGEVHKCAMEHQAKSAWSYTSKADWTWSREGDHWQENFMMSDPMEWKTNLMRFMSPSKVHKLRMSFLQGLEAVNSRTDSTFVWSQQVLTSEKDVTAAVFYKQFDSDSPNAEKQLHHVSATAIGSKLIDLDILKVSNNHLVLSDEGFQKAFGVSIPNASDETEYEPLWLNKTETEHDLDDEDCKVSTCQSEEKSVDTPLDQSLSWGNITSSEVEWGTAVAVKGGKGKSGAPSGTVQQPSHDHSTAPSKGSKGAGKGKSNDDISAPLSATSQPLSWGDHSDPIPDWGTAAPSKGSKGAGKGKSNDDISAPLSATSQPLSWGDHSGPVPDWGTAAPLKGSTKGSTIPPNASSGKGSKETTAPVDGSQKGGKHLTKGSKGIPSSATECDLNSGKGAQTNPPATIKGQTNTDPTTIFGKGTKGTKETKDELLVARSFSSTGKGLKSETVSSEKESIKGTKGHPLSIPSEQQSKGGTKGTITTFNNDIGLKGLSSLSASKGTKYETICTEKGGSKGKNETTSIGGKGPPTELGGKKGPSDQISSEGSKGGAPTDPSVGKSQGGKKGTSSKGADLTGKGTKSGTQRNYAEHLYSRMSQIPSFVEGIDQCMLVLMYFKKSFFEITKQKNYIFKKNKQQTNNYPKLRLSSPGRQPNTRTRVSILGYYSHSYEHMILLPITSIRGLKNSTVTSARDGGRVCSSSWR